jgi:hypothetical protein
LRDVIESSSIGRNSHCTASWILSFEAGIAEKVWRPSTTLASTSGRLAKPRKASMLSRLVAALAGSAKPAQARIE